MSNYELDEDVLNDVPGGVAIGCWISSMIKRHLSDNSARDVSS